MNESFSSSPMAAMALILMVPFTLALFGSMPAYRAAFLAQLIGALVLPVGFGWAIPGVTTLDKSTIPLLAAFAACAILKPGELRRLRLDGGTLVFLTALLVGPFLTAFANADPRPIVGALLPALKTWDGVAMLRENLFSLVLPFLLGRMLVSNVNQLEVLMRGMVVAFLIYSIPMLYEVRMSPQLHIMVYGYFPHSFLQQMRAGGFRPVVFLGHGLPLGILTSFAVLASVMLWRRGRKIRGLPQWLVTSYLTGIVVLCKTFSALVYAGAGGAVMYFCKAKTQLRVAVVLACIVLTYPISRTFDVFPTTKLMELAEAASAERAESLAFRFKNEDLLLTHARERWLLGWGGYGRDRIFNEDGNDISVTDGLWIILFGQLGTVGFLGGFGLMIYPIFRAGRALRNLGTGSERRLLASTAVLVALNWADSLPNALSGGVLMIFMTGAFAGVVEAYQRARVRKTRPEPVRPAPIQSPVPLG